MRNKLFSKRRNTVVRLLAFSNCYLLTIY